MVRLFTMLLGLHLRGVTVEHHVQVLGIMFFIGILHRIGASMVDTYKLTLTLEKNGKPLQGLDPLIRRLTVDQSQSFDDLLATGSGDVAFPVTAVTTPAFLVLLVDQ